MSRKLLICPWFGDLPSWWPEYSAQLPALKNMGYDILIDHDRDGFSNRVLDHLGIWPPVVHGGTKVHDFRACLGLLYQDKLAGYDWWGHTDFDCVYGRLDEFVTDAKLDSCDIYTDCQYDYISGPFSLYRVGATERTFMHTDGWKQILENPVTTGWVETSYSQTAKSRLRVLVENHHGFSNPQLLFRSGDRLMHAGKEISHYHFNRTKVWPL